VVHKGIDTSGIPEASIPNPGIEKPAPGLQSLVVVVLIFISRQSLMQIT